MIHDHGIPESHIRAVFPKISYLVLPVLSTERTVIISPQSKSNGLTNGNTSTDRKELPRQQEPSAEMCWGPTNSNDSELERS